MIGSGVYDVAEGPATFEVVRDGSGSTSSTRRGRSPWSRTSGSRRLAGPWASWGLSETGPEQTPAVIEAVWAG